MAVDAHDLALDGFWPGQVSGYSIAGGGALSVEGGGAPGAPGPAEPAPGAAFSFGSATDSRYADREESHEDFLRDVERIRRQNEGEYEIIVPVPPPLVEVRATSLRVDVRATFLEVHVSERGNLVEFVATFNEPPDEICFSHTMPGSGRPVIYEFGQPRSRIEQLSDTEYACTIDTTGFPGGLICWHFWGLRGGEPVGSDFGDEDNDRAIRIPHRPAQLL